MHLNVGTEFFKNRNFRKKSGNPPLPPLPEPDSKKKFFSVSQNVPPQYAKRILKLSHMVFLPGPKMYIGPQ